MKLSFLLLLLVFPSSTMAASEYYLSYLCDARVGFKVMHDGNVSMLRKHVGTVNPVELPAGTDSGSADKLFALAESNGFLDSSYDKGKCYITYHSPLKEHVVQIGKNAPKPIRDLFVELQNLHRSVVKQGSN